jgi:hypothetical protein
VPENEKERLNRKLTELLQELRVALPGIQVLFAFLLTLPFTARFREITETQRDVYFAAFLCAAVASAFLIAPSAYHRMRWRTLETEDVEEKRQMLVTSGRLVSVGIVFLGLASSSVVFLITDVLFGGVLAGVLTGVLTGLFLWVWFLLPIRDRVRWESRGGSRGSG